MQELANRLYRTALAYLGSVQEAEDAVQEAPAGVQAESTTFWGRVTQMFRDFWSAITGIFR